MRLIINGSEADIDKSIKVILNRKATEVGEAASAKADRTFKFTIPATETNRRLLSIPAKGQNNILFKQVLLAKAEIWVDEIKIIKGKLVVDEISESKYNCVIYSEDSDWADILKNRSINEIPATRELNFRGYKSSNPAHDTIHKIINDPDILTPKHNEKWDIVYINQKYNNPFLPNWNYEGNLFGDVRFMKNSLWEFLPYEIYGVDFYFTPYRFNDNQLYLTFYDEPPSYYLRNIIHNIFKLAGYTVQSTLLDDEEFCKIVIPYVGKENPKYNWAIMGSGSCGVNFNETIIFKVGANVTTPYNVYTADSKFWRDRQITSNGSAVHRHILRAGNSWRNYGFRWRHTYRNTTTYQPTSGEAIGGTTNSQYTAPVSGWYLIKPFYEHVVSIISLENPRPPKDGNRVISVVRLKNQSQANEDFQNLDGGTVETFSYIAGTPGIENSICFANITFNNDTWNPNDFIENNVQFDGFADENVRKINISGNDCDFLVYLEAGDNIAFVISEISTDWENNLYGMFTHKQIRHNWKLDIRHIGTGGDLLTNTEEFIPADLLWNPYKSLPPIKCLEFLENITTMFNLRFTTDNENRVVYIENNTNYYLNETAAIDLSDRVDMNEATYTELEYLKNQFAFRYALDDNNYLNPKRISVGNIDLGRYDYAYTPVASENFELKTFDVIFSPGTFRQYKNIKIKTNVITPNTITNKDEFLDSAIYTTISFITLPTLIKEEDLKQKQNNVNTTSFDFNMSLYKLKGFGSIRQNRRYFNESLEPSDLSDFREEQLVYLTCVFTESSAPLTDAKIWDLSFNEKFGLFNYLYDQEIFGTEDTYKLNIQAYLTANDYNRMTPNRLIIINSMLFRLLEISNFDAEQGGLTNLTLVKYR